jgi:predicted nucleic acid-binding protein
VRTAFLDSGAIYALGDDADPDHRRVASAYTNSTARFLTHEAILLESFSLITKRKHKSFAIRILGSVRASRKIEVVPLSKQLIEAGWQLCLSHNDKDWDWIDCLSFALMKQRKIRKALTLDRHFHQAGFDPLV